MLTLLARHAGLLDRVTDGALRAIDRIGADVIDTLDTLAGTLEHLGGDELGALDAALDRGAHVVANGVEHQGRAGMRAIDGVNGSSHDGGGLGDLMNGCAHDRIMRRAAAFSKARERESKNTEPVRSERRVEACVVLVRRTP
ncbi:MAG: hypothetical protein H0X17_19125, partial [Deltaproteobacteria bacterium]|nr:hypothetical protein [Deltaproteobacteria bacterium]